MSVLGSKMHYVDGVANLDAVFIGSGKHYLQEDEPDAIGRAISSWIRDRARAG